MNQLSHVAQIEPRLKAIESVVKQGGYLESDCAQTRHMAEVVLLAAQAGRDGNYGIGAELVNTETDEVVGRGKNAIADDNHAWGHVSHAEMSALADYHRQTDPAERDYSHLTMFTSLEPCPICTCGMCQVGVNRSVSGELDEAGGQLISNGVEKPPFIWDQLAGGMQFENAEGRYTDFQHPLQLLSRSQLDQRQINHLQGILRQHFNGEKAWLATAMRQACEAGLKGELPRGVVLVNTNGEIVAEGHDDYGNTDHDWHHVRSAENVAIAEYRKHTRPEQRSYDLTLVTTSEPDLATLCSMVTSRHIGRVVVGHADSHRGYPLSNSGQIPEAMKKAVADQWHELAQIPQELRNLFTEVFYGVTKEPLDSYLANK